MTLDLQEVTMWQYHDSLEYNHDEWSSTMVSFSSISSSTTESAPSAVLDAESVYSHRDAVFSGTNARLIQPWIKQQVCVKLRSSGKYSLAWHQLDSSHFLSTSTLLGAKLTNWSLNGLKLASEKKWRPTLNHVYAHLETVCEHRICQHIGDVWSWYSCLVSSLCWPFRRARFITDWDPCLTWITSVHEQNTSKKHHTSGTYIVYIHVHFIMLLSSHSNKKHAVTQPKLSLDADEQMVTMVFAFGLLRCGQWVISLNHTSKPVAIFASRA